MKCLVIGDSHCTKADIEECDKLYDFIIETAKEYKPDLIIELGDTVDNFGSPSSKVQHFITEKAQRLSKIAHTVFIVGNHSYDPNHPECHSLLPLKFLDNVTVVDTPMTIKGIDFMPYRKSDEQFLQEEQSLPNNLLFCHSAFRGAQYETGYKDTHALDVELTRHRKIISGHIHTASELGKCTYLGAPRWMKRSDANADKHIGLYDTETDTWQLIPTWPVVKKIVSIELNDEDILPELDEVNTRYLVSAKGKESYLETVIIKYKGIAEVKTTPVQQKKTELIEKNDATKALQEYLANHYQCTYNVGKETLMQEINNRLEID